MIAPLLILIACPPDPSACQRIRLEPQGIVADQAAMAEWISDHAGYRIVETVWRVRR